MPEVEPPSPTLPFDVLAWLGAVKKRSPVARIELLKVGYPGVCMTWTLEESGGDLDELAAEVSQLAHHEGLATASPNGRAIFRVRALDGNAQEFAQRTFAVPAAPAGSGAEAPVDHAALVSQLAKANNDLTQIVTRAFQSRDDAWQRQNELLLAQNVQLRAEHFAVMRRWQENVIMQSEQKRLDAQLAREEQRDAEILSQARTMLALLANRIAGGGPGKGAPAGSQLLSAMFQSFTPDQIDFLMSPMSPLDTNQKAVLKEMFEAFAAPKTTPLNGGASNGAAAKDEPS
jgi:hypothetical protein